MRTAGEAIAGYGFLKRFGVSVGDEITFLAGTTPLTVRIVGWYRETEDSGEILQYRIETLTAKEPGVSPDVYRVTGTKGTSPTALADEIQQRAGSSVRVEPIDTSSDTLDTFTVAIRLVALILILMAGTNLLTSLLTTTRESARRVGVEEAVGFTPRQLIGQGAVAGATLGLAAVVGGRAARAAAVRSALGSRERRDRRRTRLDAHADRRPAHPRRPRRPRRYRPASAPWPWGGWPAGPPPSSSAGSDRRPHTSPTEITYEYRGVVSVEAAFTVGSAGSHVGFYWSGDRIRRSGPDRCPLRTGEPARGADAQGRPERRRDPRQHVAAACG